MDCTTRALDPGGRRRTKPRRFHRLRRALAYLWPDCEDSLRGLETGIRDREVLGNKPGRLIPGVAHGKYLSYPYDDAPDDFAPMLRDTLKLHLEAALNPSLNAPDPDPDTNLVSGDRPIGNAV